MRVIDRKADYSDYQNVISSKADRLEIQEKYTEQTDFDNLFKRVNEMKLQNEDKLNQLVFSQYEQEMEAKLVDMQKLIGKKSNIKDVCALLDTKSNTDEVNKALDEIHNEMDKILVTKNELNGALLDQAAINEALCAENCSARWLWKSGDLVNGFAVPWEIQTINTCPENFLWADEKS